MSKFTPGKWWIAPPIFDGDVIYAPAQKKGSLNEVVATCILNKADARLIAAAPEMYDVLQLITATDSLLVQATKIKHIPLFIQAFKNMDGAISISRELLDRIDGKESHNV